MSSSLARGLFQRAILQSGPCVGDGTPTLAERQDFGRTFAEAMGCRSDDLQRELSCMRKATAEEVMTAIPLGKVLGEASGGVGYQFNRDGVVLSQTPRAAVAAGQVARVPVLLGTVDDEMGRYVGGLGVDSREDFRELITEEWGSGAERLLAAYPTPAEADVKAQLSALYSDWAMTCPVRRDARALAAVGVSVFLYCFRRAPDVFGGKAGAFHGSELAYLFPSVFKNHGLVMRDDDRKLTELITGYWSHFAATGDPNFPGAPDWPRYDSSDRHLEIDIEPRPDRGLRSTECDLWDELDDDK